MGGRRAKQVKGQSPKVPTEGSRTKVEAESKEVKKSTRVKKTKPGPKAVLKKVSKKQKTSRGKRYIAAKKKLAVPTGKEAPKVYPIAEAIKKVKESSYASFDASVDTHINLGLEVGDQEHQLRTLVTLPHGTGKTVRVLVFAEPALAKKAKEAGADKVGDEKTIEEIANGNVPSFDAIVATPSFMPKIAKVGRVLGPKGLMPTPKTGTVTDDPAKVVGEIKKGKIEIRTEAQPIVHVSIGKVSFEDKKLIENLKVVITELNRVKPSKVRGEYIKSVSLAPTMGLAVRVDPSSI